MDFRQKKIICRLLFSWKIFFSEVFKAIFNFSNFLKNWRNFSNVLRSRKKFLNVLKSLPKNVKTWRPLRFLSEMLMALLFFPRSQETYLLHKFLCKNKSYSDPYIGWIQKSSHYWSSKLTRFFVGTKIIFHRCLNWKFSSCMNVSGWKIWFCFSHQSHDRPAMRSYWQ